MRLMTLVHDGQTCKESFISATKLTFTAAALACVSIIPAMAQQTQPVLPPPPPVVSTVPANGDVNPYGVAFVPAHVTAGLTLHPYDILVSNYNDARIFKAWERPSCASTQTDNRPSSIRVLRRGCPQLWGWFSAASSLLAIYQLSMARPRPRKPDRFPSWTATEMS